ncbi:MAG TPA: CDP-alcohol phosphatidyltransferase family protein [Thermomicrobiales bacterium]|nr:CDP-alcohol phosphatidyltransferase family protein [Thermomicrobiales bacterium]
MANLITIARLILLFGVIAMIHFAPVELSLLSMILLGVVFAGDGIDGWVARRRGSTSPFGAVFDIAGDRIVETVLWVYFAWERVIPLWVPFLVIVRGGIVDALRSMSYVEGKTAFGENTMMRSTITRWLTAGRFMRGLYGYVKAAAFVFLTGYYGYIQPEEESWLDKVYSLDVVRWFGWANVWLAVALTLIRGLPVLFDAIPYIRHGGRAALSESVAMVAGGRDTGPRA